MAMKSHEQAHESLTPRDFAYSKRFFDILIFTTRYNVG